MDTFEFNKIAGAVLGTVLLFFGIGIVSEGLFHTETPEVPGYLIEVPEAGGEAGDAADAEPVSIAMLLQDASAEEGQSVARKCQACHTFEEGGAHKTGPNLWDVVGRPVAAVGDFAYSDAMRAFAEGDTVWDFETLGNYLADPKGVVPGTNMAFVGLRRDPERADMIEYLRQQSGDPVPLPEPDEPAEADEPDGADDAAASDPEAETDSAAADAEAPAETETAMADAESDSAAADGETPAESDSAAVDAETPPETETATAPADQPAEADESMDAGEADQAATAEEPAADDAAAGSPVLAMLDTADPAEGEQVARKCLPCHTFEEGGAAKIGPPLWNIVNRPVAAIEDFSYSDSMVEFAAGGTTWTYEHLDAYLEAPKDVVPKGKMAFAGVKDDEERAALLAYLRTFAPEPAPLP